MKSGFQFIVQLATTDKPSSEWLCRLKTIFHRLRNNENLKVWLKTYNGIENVHTWCKVYLL